MALVDNYSQLYVRSLMYPHWSDRDSTFAYQVQALCYMDDPEAIKARAENPTYLIGTEEAYIVYKAQMFLDEALHIELAGYGPWEDPVKHDLNIRTLRYPYKFNLIVPDTILKDIGGKDWYDLPRRHGHKFFDHLGIIHGVL